LVYRLRFLKASEFFFFFVVVVLVIVVKTDDVAVGLFDEPVYFLDVCLEVDFALLAELLYCQ
jgi:hypothetical protein